MLAAMARIVMIRHGETIGQSSVRLHGRSDVPLSAEGREQMRQARRALPGSVFDLLVASPLRRAWEGARIVLPGHPVVVERDFREIDFGLWEGCSAQEIAERSPALYRAWRERAPGFEYPGGERRDDFRARVEAGLRRVRAYGVASVLIIAHKGVIRTIAQAMTGELPADDALQLGGSVQLSEHSDGSWAIGRRGLGGPYVQGACDDARSRPDR